MSTTNLVPGESKAEAFRNAMQLTAPILEQVVRELEESPSGLKTPGEAFQQVEIGMKLQLATPESQSTVSVGRSLTDIDAKMAVNLQGSFEQLRQLTIERALHLWETPNTQVQDAQYIDQIDAIRGKKEMWFKTKVGTTSEMDLTERMAAFVAKNMWGTAGLFMAIRHAPARIREMCETFLHQRRISAAFAVAYCVEKQMNTTGWKRTVKDLITSVVAEEMSGIQGLTTIEDMEEIRACIQHLAEDMIAELEV